MRDKSRRRTGCPRGDRIGRSRTRAARTRRQTPARSRCRRCPVHDCCLAPVAPPHARERHSLETSRTRDISLSLLLSLLFHREHRQGTDKQNSFRAKKRPATSSSETECARSNESGRAWTFVPPLSPNFGWHLRGVWTRISLPAISESVLSHGDGPSRRLNQLQSLPLVHKLRLAVGSTRAHGGLVLVAGTFQCFVFATVPAL